MMIEIVMIQLEATNLKNSWGVGGGGRHPPPHPNPPLLFRCFTGIKLHPYLNPHFYHHEGCFLTCLPLPERPGKPETRSGHRRLACRVARLQEHPRKIVEARWLRFGAGGCRQKRYGRVGRVSTRMLGVFLRKDSLVVLGVS